MVDLDPIDERVRDGLARTERELEALADRLSPPETTPEAAANWADSDEGKNAGAILAQMIGEGLRLILADRPPRIPSARRPWRFTSPAAAAPPLRPAATALPPAEPNPAPPVESGRPNADASRLQIPGIDLVGHVDDKPRAETSNKFPAEHMESHVARLDINDRTPLPRSKELKGPIVGGIIPSE